MMFELPFSTFDGARARDRVARLYCSGCRLDVEIDIGDEWLRGKSFCSGVCFRCPYFVKHWTASPRVRLRPRALIDRNAGVS